METGEEAGGANPSYQGYDYQKLVSVWVALELMFGPDACADSIIVEPASHDDVMAKLAVAADLAEASLNVGGGELHVQIKFKGAGHWSAKDFASVVNDKPVKGPRGPTTRSRAAALLLNDPGRHYVFITNTSVDGVLAKGRVKVPSQRSSATFLPTNLNLDSEQKEQLSGRFALIEQMTLTETRRQIEVLLTQRLHVPTQNLDACINRLKRLVEDRFLEVPDPLRKDEIEKIAEGHGGLPHANPQLARYVAPENRTEAEQCLSQRGAVLLIGPSGYGKSLTAESLAYERRQANPPYKVMRETEGLAAIEEALSAPGRMLFHLEDPWGQSGLDKEGASKWTSRLPVLVRQASSEKQFIITSRTEVYREALGESPAPVWRDRTVSIDDSSYDASARRSILHGKLKQAGSWRQDLAQQHESRLIAELRTPLEIDAFTRELMDVSKPTEADIRALIDRALTDSRKQVVTDHVRGFGDRGVGGAAVLWALLRRSQSLDPARLCNLRRELDRAKDQDIALDDLAEHLALTQFETGADGGYRAHSKVVEPLESLARSHPRAAEKALNAATRAACNLVSTDSSWLDELLRLVAGARQLQDRNVVLDAGIVDFVDGYLTEDLLQSVGHERRFRSAWRTASGYLSSTTPLGTLVRWLERGGPRNKGFDIGWRAPAITEAERRSVLAADPTMSIMKGFIEFILPLVPDDYDADQLLPWLRAFGIDFSEAFIKAGDVLVSVSHFVLSADAISECALGWSNPPYDTVWSQILALDVAAKAALEASCEQRRQVWQGELDYAEQNAIHERAEEEGQSASNYATGYVRARRRQEGFKWIVTHPRHDLLLPLWAEVMKYSRDEVGPEELNAFFGLAGDNEHLQAEGLRVIADQGLTFARDQVLAALATATGNTLGAAVRALAWLEGDGLGATGKSAAEAILRNILSHLPAIRAATLAPYIADLYRGKESTEAAGRIVAAASPHARTAVNLALASELDLEDTAVMQLYRTLQPGEATELITSGPRALGRCLLVLSAQEGVDITGIANAWLDSNDSTDAEFALAALAEVSGAAASSAICAALGHSDYKIRRTAICLLAPVADGAQRARILEMATDKSAPVREALAKVIGRQTWEDGLPTLLNLLGDTRDYTRHPEQQRRSEVQFNVARAAANALACFEHLPALAVDSIISFLEAGEDASGDVGLHATLIGLLAVVEDPRVWKMLERALLDDRVVGQAGENLYPVRYAAAWCVLQRIQNHPLELELVPWAAIESAADHLDPQLAAPALAALGCRLATTCDSTTLSALRGQSTSHARIALALSAINDPKRAIDIAVQFALLPLKHPFLDTAGEHCSGDSSSHRWSLPAPCKEWMDSLAEGDDVEPMLLWVMSKRTGVALGDPDFNPRELRRKKGMPLITIQEMFGME
ncbi:hypothetical protein IPC790_07200 [Pseudomonas aeruginosa]|uniref:nSTAND3 domain-containing NTPase n=1 Tax=Pseudomonas aeruginosa TaxID=287 RepID=UPI000F545337|nr:hypothetical protein [Pseudomonas aeruginosa]RPV48980.1 hypothetical protein IPC790_07200 [Pseudomonas aeruginosa]